MLAFVFCAGRAVERLGEEAKLNVRYIGNDR